MRCRWIWPFLAATGLLVTGCSAFVDQDQVQITPEAGLALTPGNPVGQTFVAHHAGLSGVEVWLEAEQSNQGDLYLHLQQIPRHLFLAHVEKSALADQHVRVRAENIEGHVTLAVLDRDGQVCRVPEWMQTEG